MFEIRKRGLFASAAAFATAVALALGGAVSAQATTNSTMPESSGLVITKLEQPDTSGVPATGLPQTSDLPAIPGVGFEAYQVPLENDPLTNDGQREIAGFTLAEAQAAVAGASAGRTGVTDANGQIHWQTAAAEGQRDGQDLQAGLWLVRETSTPAGVVPAGDFIVAVPLTHPTERNTWLDTIYVYPKNHTVTGSKTVDNDGEFVVGDTVTWTITIDNPSARDTTTGEYFAADMLQVVDELTEAYLTTALDGSGMTVTAPAGLVKGTHYEVTVVSDGGKRTVTVDFTEAGLAKLVETPTAAVVLKLETKIEQVGVIENSARFSTSTSQTTPGEIPGTSMKYGSYALVKLSEGAPEESAVSLAGAEFMVFTSEEDALAAKAGDQAALDRAVRPEVTVPGYDRDAGTWTTNADGRVDITGLRYSGFADGESFGESDDRYVTYWLVETQSLDGHQLLAQPVSFIVDEDSATQTAETIVNQYDRGGFVLPLTGGTGTLLLTIGGIALLITVLLIARRRQHATTSTE
ncbi:SpaH/EbpB family LPXTG-anchored major pilin [Leucobacter sp. BZR 635]